MKLIHCPQCGQETFYEGNPHRPFCSERCKMIDLGAWATGEYRIPVEDSGEEDLEEALSDLESGENEDPSSC